MEHTLLLRLAGPMQSWGTHSRFTIRDTGQEPSKSGVVGLLCAALGRGRSEPLDDLAALRMGVRVDREGVMKREYQTAGVGDRLTKTGGIAKAGGGVRYEAVLSTRYYLSDADFLVGLEGEDLPLLKKLHAALESPVWQLFLGRKSYLPSPPVFIPDGLKEGVSLKDALVSLHWKPPRRDGKAYLDRGLRVVLETNNREGAQVRTDQPVSFVSDDRKHGLRYVCTRFCSLKKTDDGTYVCEPKEAK